MVFPLPHYGVLCGYRVVQARCVSSVSVVSSVCRHCTLGRPWHGPGTLRLLQLACTSTPLVSVSSHTHSPKPRPCSLGSRGLQATLVSRDVPAVSQSRLSPPGMTIIAGFICCYLNQAQAPCSCRSQRARRDRNPLLLLVSATPRPDGGFQSGRHGATQRSARH